MKPHPAGNLAGVVVMARTLDTGKPRTVDTGKH
jgi:hypothetical protein